jgi:hydroxymethylpyrimidine/phosphomethylpyrimidine kinase
MDIGRANRRTAILTIAGTDPGGRDGIQADLKTFAAHGCHGTSVVTAVTAQNRTGVLRHVMPPHFVEQQITSTLKDIRVHAIKTGTLFNSEITKAVASSLKCHFRTHGPVPFVCDSVYVSEYGVVLSAEDVKTVVKELFPLAHVITMSEAEAQYLLHVEDQPLQITSLADVLSAAQKLLTLVLGPQAVLLKGGRTIVSIDDILSVKAPNDAPLEIKSDFPLGDNIEILGISHSTETKDYVVDVLCRVITTEPNAFAFTLYPRLVCRSKKHSGGECLVQRGAGVCPRK